MTLRFTDSAPTRGPAPSHSPADARFAPGLGLADFLGWFSVGLGLAEALAPKSMERLTGVRGEGMLKAFGLREIATGAGILGSSTRPTAWLWGRVAGDVMDLAAIATQAGEADDPDRRTRLLASGLAVAGVTVLDVICAMQMQAADALEG
ncbi:MAG: hypothetical protein K2W96_24870 [Gemmataceae bacterium]|nr:hypothetical protein [Gemmataceae bacterium]